MLGVRTGSGPADEGAMPMSFIKRAQEAAAQAAEAAAAAPRRDGRRTRRPMTRPPRRRSPAAPARPSGMARRGVTTVIEKIDPGTLAELIIKATALQEMTNKALRQKGSPYRISRDLDLGVDPAGGQLRDQPASTMTPRRSSARSCRRPSSSSRRPTTVSWSSPSTGRRSTRHDPGGRADRRSADRVAARRCAAGAAHRARRRRAAVMPR